MNCQCHMQWAFPHRETPFIPLIMDSTIFMSLIWNCSKDLIQLVLHAVPMEGTLSWRNEQLGYMSNVTIFWGPHWINTYYSSANEGDNGNIPEGKSQGVKLRVIFPKEYCHYLPSLEGIMCFYARVSWIYCHYFLPSGCHKIWDFIIPSSAMDVQYSCTARGKIMGQYGLYF